MSGDEREVRRIPAALDIAAQFGGIDGDHHKAWVIDQMVRALTGCPVVTKTFPDDNRPGQTYEAEEMGESEEYREWVRAACEGEDGPDTYEWNVGIAP
jgi:hypothetical protein